MKYTPTDVKYTSPGVKSHLGRFSDRVRLFLVSIRFRLTLWSVVILALILLVFSVFVYIRQAQDFQIYARTQLQINAQQLTELFRIGGVFDSEGPHMSASDIAQRESMLLQAGDMMALIGPNNQTLQSFGNPSSEIINEGIQTWQTNNPKSMAVAYTTDVAGTAKNSQKVNYQFLVTPLVAEHHPIGLIILARPVDPEGQLPRLAFTLGLSSLAVLALVLIGGYWLAGRAMAPVRTITRTARGISETDLHKRLRLGTHDELGELADTFDAMLDRLQAAFDRQRQFTADASHELRTPLTIVSLEADHALARRRTADEYERALMVIKSENEYMAHLVNDLLTLARMDAGQTQVKLEPLDLSDVTLDVVERLSSLARRDQVELVTGDLPEVPIQGDRQFLTQMLTNLVENAIKYAGGSGKHVWVDTGCASDEGGAKNAPYGWVKVADDGPGIPAEELSHLFDRFYRVDKARTRQASADNGGESDEAAEAEKEPEGSGLGLSIVQWIARAHQGQVQVQSELGKGSAFEVRLPISNV